MGGFVGVASNPAGATTARSIADGSVHARPASPSLRPVDWCPATLRPNRGLARTGISWAPTTRCPKRQPLIDSAVYRHDFTYEPSDVHANARCRHRGWKRTRRFTAVRLAARVRHGSDQDQSSRRRARRRQRLDFRFAFQGIPHRGALERQPRRAGSSRIRRRCRFWSGLERAARRGRRAQERWSNLWSGDARRWRRRGSHRHGPSYCRIACARDG